MIPRYCHLNLGTCSYSSLTREPTVSQSAVSSLAGVIPTITPLDERPTPQFATSRLPKLTLPSYSGNPLDLLAPFKWLFISPKSQWSTKVQLLESPGDAARTIEGLPLSDGNYLHAVPVLQDHFG